MIQRRALVAAARVALVIGLGGLAPACGGEGASFRHDAAASGGRGGDRPDADAAGEDGPGADAGDGSADGPVDQAADVAGERPASSSNGSPCTSRDQCASGFCSDGVCCNQDCRGSCMSCAGATPGTCAPAAVGADPHNDCTAQPMATCGTTGLCDGAGACRLYPASTPCGSTPSCSSSGTAVVLTRVCNGTGACVPDTVHDCQGFLCSNASCGTS